MAKYLIPLGWHALHIRTTYAYRSMHPKMTLVDQ